MSTKGSFTSIISFEISLMSCASSLSNSLSSIQMSSGSIVLKGLSSSKISSMKLIASSCNFCSVAALLALSNSCFNLENSLSMVCVSVSIVLVYLFCGSNRRLLFFNVLSPQTYHRQFLVQMNQAMVQMSWCRLFLLHFLHLLFLSYLYWQG